MQVVDRRGESVAEPAAHQSSAVVAVLTVRKPPHAEPQPVADAASGTFEEAA